MPSRRVTLVLCTRQGDLLGALPPYEVPVPYWQEASPVVAGAAAVHGVDVTVLRLLSTSTTDPGDGGDVGYLAEVREGTDPGLLPLGPWPGDPLADEPLRATWARPGGPQADLDWADAVLADQGTPRAGPARQVKTWNLSSLWRLPVRTGSGRAGAAWLKVVPPFFSHEGALLAHLGPPVVPPVLAADGPRVLLDEVAGEDQWEAPLAVRLRMVGLLVALQAGEAGRLDRLAALGVPDWRAPALASPAAAALERWAGELEVGERGRLEALVGGLAERSVAVAACGVPDSLVHGDFHAGNVCARPDGSLVLLDWGDAGLGNPLLDQPAMLARIGPGERRAVQEEWARLWRAAVPGCDPGRAAELLEPVAALRLAVVYDRFLAGIEPDERVYHRGDPGAWLRRAAAAAGP